MVPNFGTFNGARSQRRGAHVGTMNTGLKQCARQGLALAACVLLVGCAVQRVEDRGRKTEDRTAKTAPDKVHIPNPDHFTTKGKPTKTIQTPNGPVEIYDPTQDPEVRAAFGRIYDNNNQIISTTFFPQTYGYAHRDGNRVYGSDGQILLIARAKMARSLINANACRAVIDATCTSKHVTRCNRNYNLISPDCKGDIVVDSLGMGKRVFPLPTRPKEFSAVPNPNLGAVMCKIDSDIEIISTDYKIIGPISPESIDEQINWFFSYQCID